MKENHKRGDTMKFKILAVIMFITMCGVNAKPPSKRMTYIMNKIDTLQSLSSYIDDDTLREIFQANISNLETAVKTRQIPDAEIQEPTSDISVYVDRSEYEDNE